MIQTFPKCKKHDCYPEGYTYIQGEQEPYIFGRMHLCSKCVEEIGAPKGFRLFDNYKEAADWVRENGETNKG